MQTTSPYSGKVLSRWATLILSCSSAVAPLVERGGKRRALSSGVHGIPRLSCTHFTARLISRHGLTREWHRGVRRKHVLVPGAGQAAGVDRMLRMPQAPANGSGLVHWVLEVAPGDSATLRLDDKQLISIQPSQSRRNQV